MKIRTDFVTNSSSSSYCVSLRVKLVGKKRGLKLDLQNFNSDECDDVCVELKTNADDVAAKLKDCKTLDGAKSVLMNALNLYDLLIDSDWADEFEDELDETNTNEEIVEYLAEAYDDDDDDTPFSEIVSEYNKFKKGLDRLSTLSDIESIEINEWFSGWGEFARDGVDDFLQKALPDEINSWDAESVSAFFEGKLDEDEIGSIVDHLENDSICQFDANITTTIILADGKIEKNYSFGADF